MTTDPKGGESCGYEEICVPMWDDVPRREAPVFQTLHAFFNAICVSCLMMATVPSGDPNFRPRDHDWQDERSEKAKVEAEKVPKELEVSCEATGQNVVFW